MIALVPALALALAVPPPEYDPASGVPPGGYWAPGEAPVIEPPDGEEQILVGAIMLPLGVLATTSASVMVWATVPDHCPRRLQSWGFNANRDQCQGLWIYNLIRLSYGSAAAVTGAVFLGIGLQRRNAHAKWKAKRFQSLQQRSRFSLVPGRHGGSVGWTLRF